MYDMYPAWNEPTADVRPASAPAATRRAVRRAESAAALKAVQASLDRRDNGGDAIEAIAALGSVSDSAPGPADRAPSRAPAGQPRQ